MTEKKKHYVSPSIESERVDLPVAWACGMVANAVSGTLCITGDTMTELCADMGAQYGG